MYRDAIRSSLVLCATLAGAAAAMPTSAQQATESGALEAIVVTARRVEESLQDVPISITVYDQEQLTQRNIVIAADLASYTPSLSVNQRYGSEKSSFSIRGFNQDLNTAPTVGVYFADVVGVRAQGGTTSGNTVGAGSFTDLQNVQVLKGPQGTLFGRNTTGGAVLLVPQKPTDAFEGYLEASIGNYDMRRVQGALNLPLSDTVRMRLSADRNVSDGYMRNRSGIGAKHFNDTDYSYARLSIVADLTPTLENYTIAHYSDSDTNGYALRFAICDRNATLANSDFTRYVNATAGCDQLDRQAARGDKMTDVDINNPDPFLKIEQWQIINTTTWQATDNLTLKNIISYGEFREQNSIVLNSENLFIAPELGALGLPAGAPYQYIWAGRYPGENAAAESTFTEELQLQGASFDERLNWVVGGYLEFSRPLGWSADRYSIFAQCYDLATLNCEIPLGFGIISQNRTRYSFDNHGVFAQGTYNFTEQLALTLGGRYTFDKIVGVNQSNRLNLFPLPDGSIGQSRVCIDTVRFNTPVASPEQCNFRITNKSHKPTWLVNLDYKPAPGVLTYAKWARGYRQGGINFINVGLETWDPEKVDSFEVGAKLSFSGAVRGYFNLAVFYNDFQDQQVFGRTLPKPGLGASGGSVIINAGKSELKGFEVDSTIELFDGLRLSVGYTYLDTEIKELVVPILPDSSPFLNPIIPLSQTGDPLTLTPKHRLTTTLSYTLPLDAALGDISLGATYTHTSSQPAHLGIPREVGILPSSDVLNLNLDWRSVLGSQMDLALFAINVTDEIYPVNAGGSWGSSGFDTLFIARPRTYGVRLRWNF